MNAKTPNRLESIFADVADLPRDERRSAIENACGDDEELRDELLSLVASYDDASRFFQGLRSSLPIESLSVLLDTDDRRDPLELVGRTVSHFRVEEHLGGGGMGVVYRARDLHLPRDVALKLLPPELSRSASAISRFKHEVIAASSLEHQNIAVVYEVGHLQDEQLFIAMAYYDGETLKKKIGRGPLPIERVVGYGIGMADGLAEAHRHGIIHRDIKPANIMVTRDGQVKVLDFGIAKVGDMSRLTHTGSMVGTLGYMSPEQCRGEDVDVRTDVWSTGLVLYELATGVHPFIADHQQAIIYKILNVDAPDPLLHRPDMPPGLAAILRDCLQRDREHRCPSVDELGERLRAFRVDANGTALAAVSAPASVRKESRIAHGIRRLSRTAKIAIGAALVFVVALVAALMLRTDPLPQRDRLALAVLPFTNVNVDSTLVAGLQYAIASSLTRLEGLGGALSVVPLEDVLIRRVRSPEDAARRFGVGFVVGGNVQHAGDAFAMTLDLIDTADGRVSDDRVVWGDVGRLQNDAVDALAELLQLQLDAGVRAELGEGQTRVSAAYHDYTRARGYLLAGEDEANVDTAINLLSAAIRADDQYVLAHSALGEAHVLKFRRTNDPDYIEEAVSWGTKAVELNGDLAPVRMALGSTYYERGDYEKAEKEFLRANALEPNSAEVYHKLGLVYHRRAEVVRSEEFFKRAIELKPDYWKYHNDLGILYHNYSRHEEALEPFRRMIELRPDSPWGYNNLGAQYQELGRLDEALEQYDQATQVSTTIPGAVAFAYNNRARVYYSKRAFEEAAKWFELSTAIQSLDYDSWDQLGNAYHVLGRTQEAREAWERVVPITEARLEVNPNNREALNYLAEVYAKLGKANVAESMTIRLLSLERIEPGDLIVAAKVHEILGRRDSALHYVEMALELGAKVKDIEVSVWLDELSDSAEFRSLITARG